MVITKFLSRRATSGFETIAPAKFCCLGDLIFETETSEWIAISSRNLRPSSAAFAVSALKWGLPPYRKATFWCQSLVVLTIDAWRAPECAIRLGRDECSNWVHPAARSVASSKPPQLSLLTG